MMLGKTSGLLALAIAFTAAAVPALGQTDPCVGTLSVSPTSLEYNANGAPLTTFTVTADPACNWFFSYVGGDSFILPQSYGQGTVVFDPSTNPILAVPNHSTHSLVEQFKVATIVGSSNAASAVVTATQDPALNLAWPCPAGPNPAYAACVGHVGVPFSVQLLASGGLPPYVFSTDQNHFPTGLPPGMTAIGLTLDTATGLIHGTPTGSGSFLVLMSIQDAHGAVTAAVAIITINGPTTCSAVINNALRTEVSNKNICATFTPNQGHTLQEAAQICGFKDFNWIQQILVQFDPSQFYARNLNKGFDPTIDGAVRLTSKRTAWNDPPQAGGYAPSFGGGDDPDNSYPFYYDSVTELPRHENGTPPTQCTLTVTEGKTLTFHDAPADGCLPGGVLVGEARCSDPVLAPKATSEPRGSFGGYFTHLAGVNHDGSATDLGIGFTWTSDYNGTTGGASIKKTDLAADGNGTGGVTIANVYQTTTLGTGGAPPGPPPPLALGNACNGAFGGTFNGDVVVSAGQNCTFTFGHINGKIQMNGGSLTLSAVLVGGGVTIAGGTFSFGPSTSIDGDVQLQNLPAAAGQNQVCGTTVFGNLQFLNNGASVEFGAPALASCAGNTINGNLQVQNNTGTNLIFGNTINGNLHVQNNRGPTQVSNNAVRQILHCQNNSSITGAGNTAKQKQGQCAGF